MSINKVDLVLLKKKELDILIEFDKVCGQLGVDYSLSSGTLLGAVRHQGFIPWDDDIDVAMTRDNYEKFVEKGQELFPPHLFIQNHNSDPKYPLNFGKIRDISTKLKEEATKDIDMKTGVYIDIFPIDKISKNKIIRKMDNCLISIIIILKYSCSLEWALKSKKTFVKILRIILFPLVKIIGTRNLNKLETMIRKKNNKEINTLTYADSETSHQYQLSDSNTMEFDLFTEFKKIKFEGREFNSIKNTEKYLTVMYGDYMKLPPEEERVCHHDFIEMNLENKTECK